MKIAVIGTGNVGSALGLGWAKRGHEVIFGTRDTKSEEVKKLAGKNVSLATTPEAVKAANVVALAVPWAAVSPVLDEIAPLLEGKVLIDCTNPTSAWPKMDHSSGAGGEQVAAMAPRAKVVKSFNTTGFENMQNPSFGGVPAAMFYAGNDEDSKKTVHQLATDLGFDAIDAGGLPQSHTLEVLASLWGTLAYGQKMGRGIAFHLLRR